MEQHLITGVWELCDDGLAIEEVYLPLDRNIAENI